MADKLKPGDEVSCRVLDSKIVSAYSSYDDEKIFQIIALDSKGYYLYVPEHFHLDETVVATQNLLDILGIDKRFLGSHMAYISSNQIVKVRAVLDGCTCFQCGDFYFQAEPNQPDGTLKCWLCRNYPYR